MKSHQLVFPVLMGILSAFALHICDQLGFYCRLYFTGIVLFNKYPLRAQKSVIFLIVFFLIMMPWGIRNFKVFNSFVPVSTNGGHIFLMGNNEKSSGGINYNFKYDYFNLNEAAESSKAYSVALHRS